MATYSSVLAWRIPGGAWWAAVYKVAQSRTRLKRRSSSSSRSQTQIHYSQYQRLKQPKCSATDAQINKMWCYPYKRILLPLLLSHFSHVGLCATPWTAAYQVPPSMRFSRQEYWSGLPLPSPMLQVDEPYKQYAKSKNPVKRDHIYNFIYMEFLN